MLVAPLPPIRPIAVLALPLLAALCGVLPLAAQELAPELAQRFNEGVVALKGGRPAEAEAIFSDVLKRGGAAPFVHHNLGIALQQQGRHRAAVVQFTTASRLDPTYGPARLLAGTSLLALGDVSGARAELRRAVRLMPREPAAHAQLAEAHGRAGDVEATVDAYRRAAELAPADPEYAYRLGKAYLTFAQWAHERILQIDPNSARLHQALGREYLRQGQVDLARRAFEQAAEVDPSLPEIHLALARIHFDRGRWREAAREIERELVVAPSSKAALQLKVQIEAARPK